jgi:hypothetical protein
MELFRKQKNKNNSVFASDLFVPVKADLVLSPQLCYGEPLTAIYFITDDEKYGRITFEKLDSIKVSRGEYFPYEYEKNSPSYCWVKIVQNSNWLNERYTYENKYYNNSYEFNGNVNEMLSDYKHYVFSFHDEFIEVLASGFWSEVASESLFGKELAKGHPFLPLSNINMIRFEAYGLTCQARLNNKADEEIMQNSIYCSQKLIEFALELENVSVNHTLCLIYKDGKHLSRLKGYFGSKEIEFDKIARLEDVKPYIEVYMKEVSERRKLMGK